MKVIIATTLLSLLIVACAVETDELEGSRAVKRGEKKRGDKNGDGIPDDEQETVGDDDDSLDPASKDPTQPGACKEGIAHPGFANFNFVSDRKPGAIGENRRRIKPYTALTADFQRATGNTPAGLAAAKAAFGDTPARWYSEPTAGAVSLYTTYTLAFTACYDSMTQANFATAPTAATADEQCKTMQRKTWQRSPTPDEIKGCTELLTTGLATETDARRRWAHACASIMTSSGFTTY